MRQLKYHEKKLLRKVDLYSWKRNGEENNLHVAKIMKRYHLQKREDYIYYQRICGMITKLTAHIKQLPNDDTFRIAITDQLLTKLYNIGIIQTTKSLQLAENVTVSAFCRRRLPILMVRLKMSETIQAAVTFIEQGQVRVGPDVVTDPSYCVPRTLEDYITWVDTSKIKRTIQKYNNQLDDFDLL